MKCPRNITPYKQKDESNGTIQFIDHLTSRTKRILSACIGHGSIIAREGPIEVKQTIDPDKGNNNFNFI